MKKALFSIALLALFTVGCSSNTEQGAAHGHPHNADGSHTQEEFTIEGDSVKVDTTSHQHDGHEDHQH